MRTGGIQDQHHQTTFAIRSLAHLSTAVGGSRGVSARVRSRLFAASLLGDAVLARRAVTDHRNRALEVLLNTADAFAWAWCCDDDPVTTRTAFIATIVPSLMETGFRLGAGTEAVPVTRPPRPWRPAWSPRLRDLARRRRTAPAFHIDGRRIVEVITETAIDLVPPLAVTAAVRRRRGLRTGPGAFGWGALAVASGYAVARGRARAQRDTTATWDERTTYLLSETRVQSRVQSALVHNVARVDPKGMLVLLERAGCRRAGQVLDELVASSDQVISDAGERGLTLAAAVDLRTVNPDRHRIRWVSETQVRHLRNEIERIDRTLSPELAARHPDDRITVVAADLHGLVIEYRGCRIEATQPTPRHVIRLEPTIPGLLGSSAWTLAIALPTMGGVPLPAVAGSVVTQWFAVWRLSSRDALERRGDRFTAILVGTATVLLNVVIAITDHRGPAPVFGVGTDSSTSHIPCPATTATQALSLLIGGSWNDLEAERWWLVAIAVGSWLLGSRGLARLDRRAAVTELAFLLMPALASATVGAKTRREAQILDAALHDRLTGTMESTARDVARDQIRQFTDQLTCVIDELPQLHPGLSDDDVAEVVRSFTAERTRIVDTDPLELIGW